MFVSLDLGWLEHPFLVNSFLITDEQQLATLRELGLSHVSHDPQRSKITPLTLVGDVTAVSPRHITPASQLLMTEKLTRTLSLIHI